jgi:NAD(P)-dependent dehydrogenase (short-subunit alcohol dehydrogenase family)
MWAMITGGAVGIGSAITTDLASQGINVIITYRNSKDKAENLINELIQTYKIDGKAFKMDGCLESDVMEAFKMLDEENIIMSILVNNAGDYLYKNILDVEYEEWKYIIDNNLNATFLVTKYFLENRVAKSWGRVINIGYVHSGTMTAKTMITPYYIAKTGVYQLTMTLAKELSGENITINMISPGVMENSVNVGKELGIYRYGKLKELVELVNYLISNKADYINGSQIDIGGGFGV